MAIENVVEQIPEWALYYMEYGDASGLTDDEVEMVQEFYESYRKDGKPIQYIDPVRDESNSFNAYFSKYPAFGLPGNVIDCFISYIRTSNDEKQ